MGKRMFGSLEEQLAFAENVGLDPSSLRPQDIGVAFGAVQRGEPVAANKPLPGDTFEVVHAEVLEAVPSLNE